MAVFRITSFTKISKLAKQSIRYITHRRGRNGKTVTRQLFGREGGTDKTEAYEKIDKALRGTTFFRMMISPDPLTEDTLKDLDLREIMDQTMLALQKKFPKQQLEYFAAIHADHTDKRHVHILAAIPRRLQKYELEALIREVTTICREQRRGLDRELGPPVRAAERLDEEEAQAPRHVFAQEPEQPRSGSDGAGDREQRRGQCHRR